MKCPNNTGEQQRASRAWGPAGHLTPHKDILRALRQHTHTLTQYTRAHNDAPNFKTLKRLNHPRFSIMSLPTVRGASCCSIMMIKHINPLGYSPPRHPSSCLPNDERLFMILLFSPYMYCLTYVVPYISLTPPWTQRIHLTQRINGRGAGVCSGTSWRLTPVLKEHLSPLTHIEFIFLALARCSGMVRSFSSQGKLPIVQAETWSMLAHNERRASPLQSCPKLPSHSQSLEL